MADFIIIVSLALVGGLLFHRLRLPVILGYILAGLLIGPNALGLIGETERVQTIADMGVALLLFTLGIQLSLAQLAQVSRVAIFGGIIQILLTMVLGVALGPVLGISLLEATYFGAMIALSSTMVATKILMERGEIDSLHGRIAVGLLLVQDLSVVPMIIILPRVAQSQSNWIPYLLLDVAKAGLFVAATYLLGRRVVPRLLFRVAAIKSPELFLLFVVTLALGIALIAYLLGMSFAFGAFIAGLIISESEFSRQALGRVVPLRDIFATLFFVSVGMLVNPNFLWSNALLLLLVVAVIVIGKFVITSLVPLFFGYPGRAAIYASLVLVQFGEFSFVLAKVGLDKEIISNYLYSMVLASAVLTILVTPLGIYLGRPLVNLLYRIPKARPLLIKELASSTSAEEDKSFSHHVVVCGYGRASHELVDSLSQRGFHYVVIEHDPHIVRRLRAKGIPCIYGDASNSSVLAHANISQARVLVVALPDPVEAELAVRNALEQNPRLDVIARAHGDQEYERLRQAGSSEVVYAEFEAALEFVRHTLHRLGVSSTEIQWILSGKRERYL
ncbi:MAG: cation:proton antiporter [Chloroflexi bacterium]|nr:cation:proton antiporter [Chloroflexota bacterium]